VKPTPEFGKDATMKPMENTLLTTSFLIFCCVFRAVLAGDVTNLVFGSIKDAIPAAYGDFNSDEFTDVFIIRNNSKTVEILFGGDAEPLLSTKKDATCHFRKQITNVMPGDFDGDSFMDVLVSLVAEKDSELREIYINWGGLENLTCANDLSEPLIRMHGEPLALDYDRNMILDLFGMEHREKARTFWIFSKENRVPEVVPLNRRDTNVSQGYPQDDLSVPHSHAILDLNDDHLADLFLTTETHFEVWLGVKEPKASMFEYSHKIHWPVGAKYKVGQSIFLDVELKGKLNLIVPICFDHDCHNSTILMHAGDKREHFHNLQVNLKDDDNQQWGFTVPEKGKLLTETITIRGGDFNMDGYPDLIATLTKTSGNRQTQTFLLENIPCSGSNCDKLSRTFAVKWKALLPFANGTVMGSFYDFYQDGILDVVLVEKREDKYRPLAFRNTLDYDANFVKVIVLTGLTNKYSPSKKTPLGRNIKRWGELKQGDGLFLDFLMTFLNFQAPISPARSSDT
jgi:integrin alpha FG-GAP repeat containing protein 1